MTTPYSDTPRRWLFVLAIFTGSFLLFLVQPMVARMALPRLGGAPNVWNSAMLVYQALLLCGYAYAHYLGRLSLAKQGWVHLAVLVLAGLTLPLSLAEIDAPAPGWEALWVPWLFLLTVGPAFFAISAQAPLVQRWFAAHPAADNPYPLYAASNLGSFGGLLAYPLLAEPLLPLANQTGLWAVGYALLVLLVAALVWARRGVAAEERSDPGRAERLPVRRLVFWLALSAVPSGLMLSTTTFLTTDIMAMPLLWVIPLGLYLLSFSIAFAEGRTLARWITVAAPVVLLSCGAIAIYGAGRGGLGAAASSIALLFAVAVALHARLYDDRPEPAQLTRFYLVMSAGGVLGGLFTALIAPVVFDWTWEHPILILAAAALVPLAAYRALAVRLSIRPVVLRWASVAALILMFWAGLGLFITLPKLADTSILLWTCFALLAAFAMVMAMRRPAFLSAMVIVLLTMGGLHQAKITMEGERTRSYFGIYSVRSDESGMRTLTHGTTTHGLQLGGEREFEPTSYYGRMSGVGLALDAAPQLYGPKARIGVVGLGVGTLACYARPEEEWTFFEIDPAVLHYSNNGTFTFLSECTPDAAMRIGDARLELADEPAGSLDLLVVDAFSSDSIPLHLLTAEALQVYRRVLTDDGLLLIHISNRFIRLEPVLSALADEAGMKAAIRRDDRAAGTTYASNWVALSADPVMLEKLTSPGRWSELQPSEGEAWTDDYASLIPYLEWKNFL